MKKLWSVVCNNEAKRIALNCAHAKCTQNGLLEPLILSTDELKIVEAMTDRVLGTSVMSYHPSCLNPSAWYTIWGIISEIYRQQHEELNADNSFY